MIQSTTLKLLQHTIASCTCFTKTNDIKYHNEDCRYRVISEAIEEITQLRGCLFSVIQMDRNSDDEYGSIANYVKNRLKNV